MKNYFIHASLLITFMSSTLISKSQQSSIKKNSKNTTQTFVTTPTEVKQELTVKLENLKQNAHLLREQALTALNNFSYNVSSNTKDCDINFDEQDLKSKEINMEINANKMAEIFIENSSRTIEVKTWDNPKIKVTTTVYFQGDDSKISDEVWFEKLNISFKTMTNLIRVKSGLVGGNNFAWPGGASSGVAVFDGEGQNIGTKNNIKRIVTIYVPKDNKIDVESKYADVNLTGNYNKLNAEITNGNLEIENTKNLILRSKYSNVSITKVDVLEAEFINGRLNITDAKEADLDTKYSTIEIGTVDILTVKSSNDEYEIEELGSIIARKNYGNLRITKLKNNIELDGTNADLKIRNIDATVTLIKIDDKYADLRLPMRNIKNYSVEYNGPYSTIYSNFEKKPLPVEPKKANEDVVASTIRSVNRSIANAYNSEDDCGCNDKFKATVGDGKGAKVEIKCQNCTVDFK